LPHALCGMKPHQTVGDGKPLCSVAPVRVCHPHRSRQEIRKECFVRANAEKPRLRFGLQDSA
jgi:hypothetical protein